MHACKKASASFFATTSYSISMDEHKHTAKMVWLPTFLCGRIGSTYQKWSEIVVHIYLLLSLVSFHFNPSPWTKHTGILFAIKQLMINIGFLESKSYTT
ncbi:hypothetical protein AQUCO_12200008v1 [Aquilegia coerulea]|uniref:Uncharacterized protein n=1 Tax=Aquilegia coerulea TaxID=218851 RepID=A0A2G5C1Q7_AQUCA|nr:hypothetical protein AQUCO_12200008v1 [Aquilegia coerulea]